MSLEKKKKLEEQLTEQKASKDREEGEQGQRRR